MRLALVFAVQAFLTAGSAIADTAPRILAIGDSLLAWEKGRGRSITDVVADDLNEPVRNRAVGGARMIYGLPISGALGMNIPKQFIRKRWDWVIVSGGGNDLWMGCGCARCDQRITRMVSKDGRSGVVPNLLRTIRKTGARVVIIGYLRSPGVPSMIDGCRAEADIYEGRLARMAKAFSGVYFISNARLVPHGSRSFHAGDMIHPSVRATKAIGDRIAMLIQERDPNR